MINDEKRVPRGCMDLLQEIRRATRKGESLRVADLQRALGYGASTMHFRLSNLEEKGFVRVNGARHAPKVVELLEEGVFAVRRLGVPIYGCIRAGVPAPGENNAQEFIESWDDFLPNGEQFFVSFADGDSMTGDGIMKGDAIMLMKCESLMFIPEGSIAAVSVDEEGCSTLKRVFFESSEDGFGAVRLRASNPDYPDLVVPAHQVTVAGIYVGLVRLAQGWSRK